MSRMNRMGRAPARSRLGLTWLGGAVLLLALALAACGGDDEGTSPTSPAATDAPARIELADSSGETLVLEGPAQRIVSHSPAATEILFAIGVGERVVAVDEFSNYPLATEALPKVSYSSPDPEQALSHEPDLVIFATRQQESLGQFRDLGLPVFFMEEPADLAGVLQAIRTLGALTGNGAEAEAVAADMEARLAAIEERLATVEQGPRVFFELTDDLYTVSPESFIGGALTLLKAQNIAAGASSPFPQLSSEAVVDADPEVILRTDGDFVPVESVPARPGWSGITAVVEGRIHDLDGDVMSRPGPRIVDGIETVAKLLYPELFQ